MFRKISGTNLVGYTLIVQCIEKSVEQRSRYDKGRNCPKIPFLTGIHSQCQGVGMTYTSLYLCILYLKRNGIDAIDKIINLNKRDDFNISIVNSLLIYLNMWQHYNNTSMCNISLSWSDIPESVLPIIMISLIEGYYWREVYLAISVYPLSQAQWHRCNRQNHLYNGTWRSEFSDNRDYFNISTVSSLFIYLNMWQHYNNTFMCNISLSWSDIPE
jgi:hypothetical protein